MATPIEGRNGRFQVDGANANVEQFSAELSTDRVEVTGWEDQDPATGRTQQNITDGPDRIVVNAKGYVDQDALPASFGFVPGSILSNVILFFMKNNLGMAINIKTAKVLKVIYQAQIKDKIMFDVTMENTGTPVEKQVLLKVLVPPADIPVPPLPLNTTYMAY